MPAHARHIGAAACHAALIVYPGVRTFNLCIVKLVSLSRWNMAMELSAHPFSQLFAQLRLADDNAGIQAFIAAHSPLPDGMRLEDAPFWSPAQAQLLREERQDDADWAMVVDRLNVALHAASR